MMLGAVFGRFDCRYGVCVSIFGMNASHECMGCKYVVRFQNPKLHENSFGMDARQFGTYPMSIFNRRGLLFAYMKWQYGINIWAVLAQKGRI